MGNHSDTGELLEEAWAIPITEMSVSGVSSLVDEYGNTIELDNPTRLKDSSDRDVELIRNDMPSPDLLTPKQFEAMEAKRKKKKTS
jgi:hypothetical protein